MKKLIILLLLLLPLQTFAFGWITDTHIGGDSKRKTEFDTIYPSKALKYLESYFKSHRGTSVLITGDISHKGRKQDYSKLRKLAGKYNINLLLAKGNHDLKGMPETHYSTVVDGCKLIVLDSNYIQPTGSGGISPDEMNWLKNELKSDLPVVVAMHHPPFHPITAELMPEYSEFVEVVSGVKFVLSGHNHVNHSRGIFQTQSAFSQKTHSSREINCR